MSQDGGPLVCDDGHVVRVEHFDELDEVGTRASEMVNFVDDDVVDLLGANRFEKLLKGGPDEGGSGERPFIKVIVNQRSALPWWRLM